MLFLLMQLEGDRYALDVAHINEVLPLVTLRPLPRAPASIAGFVDYGGEAVPVIDLSQLLAGRPAHRQMSTRLVIAHYESQGRRKLVGLIAERATETLRRDPSDFRASAASSAAHPRLGPVALDAAGPIHWLPIADLLPGELVGQVLPHAVGS
jgi:chemotaxis-related protein WspB